MSRSQGVVFGYGAIIPTRDFVLLFPRSFVFNDRFSRWEEGTISKLNNNLVHVFYSINDLTDTIFITTKSAIQYRFEKGCIRTPDVGIDMNRIIHEGYLLTPWLMQHFPKASVGFMMYGCYTA